LGEWRAGRSPAPPTSQRLSGCALLHHPTTLSTYSRRIQPAVTGARAVPVLRPCEDNATREKKVIIPSFLGTSPGIFVLFPRNSNSQRTTHV
uniref:Uncharacterized protein n=1 Tax=Triticum urartu TaxID=4572 RepID=A0A8R7UJ30_TRIUA